MEDLHRESENLYNTIKNYCGTCKEPQVLELERRARKLYDHFQTHKNTRLLEKEATEIKEYLYHMSPGAMTTTHCSYLKLHYEQLRIHLRSFQ